MAPKGTHPHPSLKQGGGMSTCFPSEHSPSLVEGGVGVGTLPPALIIYPLCINRFIQVNIRQIRVAGNKGPAGQPLDI